MFQLIHSRFTPYTSVCYINIYKTEAMHRNKRSFATSWPTTIKRP